LFVVVGFVFVVVVVVVGFVVVVVVVVGWNLNRERLFSRQIYPLLGATLSTTLGMEQCYTSKLNYVFRRERWAGKTAG